MASAQVTLKVTPHELQVIKASLKMYAYANKYLNQKEGREHPLDGFVHDVSIHQNDPRKAVMTTQKLMQDIGLK